MFVASVLVFLSSVRTQMMDSGFGGWAEKEEKKEEKKVKKKVEKKR